ncbi:hypothetical protein GCM10011297_27230 [Bacterioplanes sanyensis]|uniref:YrbL family protein n=1 Tax=Bacterioplanes sanyensis TaxID=1249553 RepID=UPI0016721DCC|nr:YrbL family protein [Bacterioplanes sanyensis]GGY52971.1 hypothetical protein GCM10011297_27230 [Bacterioplanes sanyensis]
MLTLTPELLLGKGRDRDCYQHPDNTQLCVKVARRPEKQTRRERAYFQLLQKQGKDTSRLALYRGMVNTNLGPAAVFDRVCKSDGSSAPTLHQALLQGELSPQQCSALVADLKHYLMSNAICVRDLSPNNLMLQRQGEQQRLVVIDGVSNPGINPLNLRCPALARYYLGKAWRSFERKLQQL